MEVEYGDVGAAVTLTAPMLLDCTASAEAPRDAHRLDDNRVRRIKAAYTTRYVSEAMAGDPTRFRVVTGTPLRPRAGDVVLARVNLIGQHQRIETPDSRRATLFEGDEILVAYGS